MDLIKRVDTPERRESRIQQTMSDGLSREEAEYIDDTQVSIGDALMSLLEERVNAVMAEKPDLAALVFHDLVAAMETTFTDAHTQVHVLALLGVADQCEGSAH